MTKRNKQALWILLVSILFLGLSIWGFEIGSGGGAVGLITAIGITLGGAGIIAGVTMLSTKNRLGWFDNDDLILETIFKKEKKEMTKIKKEEPVAKQTPVKKEGSESIGLMQRENELVKRSQELNLLVNELETELANVRDTLETKGWIQSADGWVIG